MMTLLILLLFNFLTISAEKYLANGYMMQQMH